jgi:hypothetical protein
MPTFGGVNAGKYQLVTSVFIIYSTISPSMAITHVSFDFFEWLVLGACIPWAPSWFWQPIHVGNMFSLVAIHTHPY